ncbi:MAG: hypothetical protein KTR30_20745 [Saprospiraceae bacterium]|nr:hypothetical protein [Saprospiraceae bacterium]
MRSGQHIEEAFHALRTTPTEFSLEQVEHLITTLPALPWWKNWLHYFNLNSILMSAIAISLAVASLFLPTKAEQEIQTATLLMDPVELTSVTSNDNTLSPTEPERPQVAVLVAAKERDAYEVVAPKRSDERDTSAELTVETEVAPPTPTLDFLRLPKSLPQSVTENEPALEITRCAPIPHQGSRAISTFKQELLLALQEDHLIHSIKQNVLVEVPGGEIRVNGQRLDQSLFSRYANFLYSTIPPCQGRYLVISRQFFGAGSYTEEGLFKGLSINPEQMPSLTEFKASIFPEEEVSKGMTLGQALVRSRAAAKGHVKSVVILEQEELKATNALPLLQWSKMKRLKRKLMTKLVKDKLMSRMHRKAIVGLYENQVVVNGKILDKSLETSYRNLIVANFGINSGPQREIHVAPKFIMIGDFGDYGEMLRGQSHGKNMIVNKTQLSGLYADKSFRKRHDVKRWE